MRYTVVVRRAWPLLVRLDEGLSDTEHERLRLLLARLPFKLQDALLLDDDPPALTDVERVIYNETTLDELLDRLEAGDDGVMTVCRWKIKHLMDDATRCAKKSKD